MSARVRAGVVGFTGYSGAEAVRILRHHPSAEPLFLEHRAQSEAEKPVFEDMRQSLTAIGVETVDIKTAARIVPRV